MKILFYVILFILITFSNGQIGSLYGKNYLITTEDLVKFYRYAERKNRVLTLERINRLMRVIYYSCGEKIRAINNLRFEYEQTSQFEQGYVFAEIIESYQKMVQINKIMNEAAHMHYTIITKVMHLQTYYFQIYHLVNMLHEISRKYPNQPDAREKFALAKDGGANGTFPGKITFAPGFDQKAYDKARTLFLEEEEKKRHLLRLKKKMLKQERLLFSKLPPNVTSFDDLPGTKYRIPYPGGDRNWPYYNRTFWNLDYGWDVDFW